MKQVSISNEFLSLTVLDYGAIIKQLIMNDKAGNPTNLVVGLGDPEAYLQDHKCMGACVGRFAGRISGSFQLDGKDYPLHTVAKDVHLHGGKEGFFRKFWIIEEVSNNADPHITLSYTSPHMEEGYPGTVRSEVTYTLKNRSLHIAHKATTDRKTVINLVNHSYFILDNSDSLDKYHMKLNCEEYLETRDNLLPTGRILSVQGTPYDFRMVRLIGSHPLDTPFLISKSAGEAAQLYSTRSGISLRVKTNQPAVVVYTPPEFTGICFETQNLPDAPNMPHFPSSVLEPGAVYHNTSEFMFGYIPDQAVE